MCRTRVRHIRASPEVSETVLRAFAATLFDLRQLSFKLLYICFAESNFRRASLSGANS